MYVLLKKFFIPLLFMILSFIACATDEEANVISGTDTISLFSPEDEGEAYGNIHFEFSQFEAKYIILVLFSEEIYTSGDDEILNWDQCIGGIRTNMYGFSRGSIYLDKLRAYNSDDDDFTGDEVTLETGKTYHWAVIGFNDSLDEIIESSPCFSFDYTDTPIPLNDPVDYQTISGNYKFTFDIEKNGDLDQAETYYIAVFSGEIVYAKDPYSMSWDNCAAGMDSGMNYYHEDYAFLNDMHPPSKDGESFDTSASFSLTDGETYYWMVWGVNAEGNKMVSKSEVRRFVYEELVEE